TMIARSHNLCRTRRPNLQLSVGHCRDQSIMIVVAAPNAAIRSESKWRATAKLAISTTIAAKMRIPAPRLALHTAQI
ncbi:hypothetical protein, partial [Burkholderia contaminans]|uniref:hypothetical protein n=1 Tax=Burkholderia contaminans TaxID=488447 RepID=UPI001C2E4622